MKRVATVSIATAEENVLKMHPELSCMMPWKGGAHISIMFCTD